MKKIIATLCLIVLLSFGAKAQIMVSKMLGKDANNYGLGYGVFTYLELPMANQNQAVRFDIDLNLFAIKGESIFTTSQVKGYASGKVGYKYVFGETNTGLYVLPAAGYCYLISTDEWGEAMNSHGIAGAFETGYTFGVGQVGNTLNLGLRYEYDRGRKNQSLQSAGVRLAFAFGLLRKQE